MTLVVALDAFKDLKCVSKIRQVLNHGLKTHGQKSPRLGGTHRHRLIHCAAMIRGGR